MTGMTILRLSHHNEMHCISVHCHVHHLSFPLVNGSESLAFSLPSKGETETLDINNIKTKIETKKRTKKKTREKEHRGYSTQLFSFFYSLSLLFLEHLCISSLSLYKLPPLRQRPSRESRKSRKVCIYLCTSFPLLMCLRGCMGFVHT